MRTPLIAALLLGLSAGAYAAQITASDREYITKDAQGSMYEEQVSKLAEQKATNPQIKQYAAMLVQDHSNYTQSLQGLAQSLGVQLPTSMSADDSTRLAELNKLSGADFDRAYVKEAKRINEQDAQESKKEEQSAKDPSIVAFIKQFKETDEKHRQAADALPTG